MSDRKTWGLQLADTERVECLLDRMAEQIIPTISGETSLLGILRRGAPLAQALADRVERTGRARPVVGKLKLKRYADDLTLLHEQPELDESTLDIEIEDRHLILVDDVIYSGESMFRACCFLRTMGAKRLQLAALCVRGKADMPLRTDFVGLQLDIGPDWIIDCAVPPYEDELGIVINPRPD
ncbi:MAG: phosphoribosyltransferase family protein [Xanthomonadales bacterium]|nr:phosphoribosyltransferase family protein [Xanthomonadales bacterium]